MRRSVAGIVHRNGRFLVGHRLPGGDMGERWEFPGGKVDGDESPEEALRREFDEEMGIPVRVGGMIGSAEFEHGGKARHLLAYEVDIPGLEGVVPVEHSEFAWATLDEIRKLDFVDSDLLLLDSIARRYAQ
ncbi:MAG TPA: NUDIX domain-containing protein [Treponemataceae bacterium]|nr:NUDIX domain-containing protein [Treponemataceae bacterium]